MAFNKGFKKGSDSVAKSIALFGIPGVKVANVLSTATRAKIPAKKFALPGKRAYPIENKAHAANAKARAAQFASPAQKAIIDRKANKVLYGKSK